MISLTTARLFCCRSRIELNDASTESRLSQKKRCAWKPSRRERCESDRGAPTPLNHGCKSVICLCDRNAAVRPPIVIIVGSFQPKEGQSLLKTKSFQAISSPNRVILDRFSPKRLLADLASRRLAFFVLFTRENYQGAFNRARFSSAAGRFINCFCPDYSEPSWPDQKTPS